MSKDEVAVGMRLLDEDPLRERPYYRNFRRILLRRVFRVLHAKQEHERHT